MFATQTAYPTETSVYPNELDCASIFGMPYLDEQALKIKGGFNKFFKNFLDNNLNESNELWSFKSLCIAQLGVNKGKQAFFAWLKSLGSGAEYLAKGIMKFGRWFNTIEERYQKVLRDDVQSWQISWLKKLMKFPVEELVDAAVEGRLKEVVVGGMKEKKRELHVDGYAKIVSDPHDMNLKGKIGRLVHYCEEKAEWLWELPDSELTDSGLPDSGLATSNWFTAEQLEVANKPRSISKQSEQKIKEPKDKCPERTQTVEPRNVGEDSKKMAASNTATIFTQGLSENQSTIPVDVRFESSSPSSTIDEERAHNKSEQENNRPLNQEVSVALEQKIAQIRIEADQTALSKAESIFGQQLQEKDLELAELRLQQSDLSGKLIFTPQEFRDSMRAAIAVEQEKNALEVQAAFAKAESYFVEQLQSKDLELAELRAQQSNLSGKLIFTPQEFDERIQETIAAEQEKSYIQAKVNQERQQELEEKVQELQLQTSELEQALAQERSDRQLDNDSDKTTLSLDNKPDKEYDNIRAELNDYKSIFTTFFKDSAQPLSVVTPEIGKHLVSGMIALLAQKKVTVSEMELETGGQQNVNLLEFQLNNALKLNQELEETIKGLEANIDLKQEVQHLEKKLAKVNQQNSLSTGFNPRGKAFVPTPRNARHK